MKKPPAFPVYTKDFDTDEKVVLMDLAEEGAYGRLLRHQWREGSIPSDLASIARILRVSQSKARRIWSRVAECFQKHPSLSGRMSNAKLEKVRAEQAEYLTGKSKAGKKGADARWRHEDANGKPMAQPLAKRWPSVSVAVPVPTTTNGIEEKAERANPLVNRVQMETRFLELVREIAPQVGLDPTEVARKGSAWNGRGLVNPASMSDDRLAHSVASLEAWARKLKGQVEPELPASRAAPSPRAQNRVDVIAAGVMGGLKEHERGELGQGVHGAVRRLPGSGHDS